MADPKFKIGDKVTFTNDYGVKWGGKMVTAVKAFPDGGIFGGQTRYYIEPTDAPWFPICEDALTLECLDLIS